MNSNEIMKQANAFYNSGNLYQAVNLLKRNQLNQKDYYILLADVYMMLSNYKEAIKMYSNSIIACTNETTDTTKLFDFKRIIRHKQMEADQLLSFTFKTVAQYSYDNEDYFYFIDTSTYELIEVPRNVVKYVQLEELKEYVLVTDVRTHSVINVIDKE